MTKRLKEARISHALRRSFVRATAAVAFALTCTTPMLVSAQETKQKTPKADKKKAEGDSTPPKIPNPRLFRRETPFDITLTLNLKQIKKDKQQDAPWRTATVSYTDSSGKKVSVPVRAKTRGVWRLKHCDFPPLRLKFGDKSADGTEFANLDEPKLVGYCRNTPQYEQYNLQEAQLYRVYRQLTDLSHKVRILRIAYADSATGTVETTRYGFIIEDPAQMAARAGGKILARKGAKADDLEPSASAMAYTFLYFIANTDVSFNGLHNGEIVSLPNGLYAPVSYDFDFSGVINAHYAGTDPSLPIRNVRTRLFRGWCSQEEAYPAVYEIFRQKRPAIEALYADSIGRLITPGTIKNTLAYYDEFYKEIRTDETAKKSVFRDCLR
ncbi:hypothetical protein [Gemmatimonas sp.]|uniref:hypothetical protein n=1 Tax=Gemmatimonas sp. TaxID=1962908 RepID=UPI00333F39DA